MGFQFLRYSLECLGQLIYSENEKGCRYCIRLCVERMGQLFDTSRPYACMNAHIVF